MLEVIAQAITLAPESLRQEDSLGVKDNLDYMERPCLKANNKQRRQGGFFTVIKTKQTLGSNSLVVCAL